MSLCAALAAIISLSFHLSQYQLSVGQFFWTGWLVIFGPVCARQFVSGSSLLDISISRLPYLCLSYFLTCLELVVPGSVIRICLRPATLQHFSCRFNQLKGYLVLDE
ncbi:hypothetical protein C8J56DRAFT_1038899 [Mycena floridula]|nr:hypothetical protein C8J56DRAFT_1038899 [Mycena floridula]